MSESSAAVAASLDAGAARTEPLSWRAKTRTVVGAATFFNAFDTLAIVSVLPVLTSQWQLSPPQIAFLISAGILAQLFGALFFAWFAEHFGRLAATAWATAIFAVTSFLCAFAWDYDSLLILRTIQSIGLGGQLPAAAVYISELAKARSRGRFVLLYQLIFPVGLIAASFAGSWIVPNLGWQYMFIVGSLAAFVALYLRRLLPESLRWLALRGRDGATDAAILLIEGEAGKAATHPHAPPPGSAEDASAWWSGLLALEYLQRTVVVWMIWFAVYFLGYGLAIWMPTVYHTVFGLPVDVALHYSLITQIAGLLGGLICAFSIDFVGRRIWFAISFMSAGLVLVSLTVYQPPTAEQVFTHVTVAYFFISSIGLGVYLYTAELYPTRVRTLGVAAGAAWLHVASSLPRVRSASSAGRSLLPHKYPACRSCSSRSAWWRRWRPSSPRSLP